MFPQPYDSKPTIIIMHGMLTSFNVGRRSCAKYWMHAQRQTYDARNHLEDAAVRNTGCMHSDKHTMLEIIFIFHQSNYTFIILGSNNKCLYVCIKIAIT